VRDVKRTLLSWSSGKDAAWALHVLRQDPEIEVLGLFTVVNQEQNRVAMHGAAMELLACQAEAAGLPLCAITLPHPCPNDLYEAAMGRFLAEASAAGIEAMAFGDLFLEDVRRYREGRLAGTGIEALFPLWGRPTGRLAEEMLAAGLEAYISGVDLARLPAPWAGRRWSAGLLRELPAGVDPCGENGEFHTVVAAGPMFRRRIAVRVEGVVIRDGFAYADVVPEITEQTVKIRPSGGVGT